jgi:hypothetical protein
MQLSNGSSAAAADPDAAVNPAALLSLLLLLLLLLLARNRKLSSHRGITVPVQQSNDHLLAPEQTYGEWYKQRSVTQRPRKEQEWSRKVQVEMWIVVFRLQIDVICN